MWSEAKDAAHQNDLLLGTFSKQCFHIKSGAFQHPHRNEPERIARGRRQILLGHRDAGKLGDRETVQLMEDLNRNLPLSEKVCTCFPL